MDGTARAGKQGRMHGQGGTGRGRRSKRAGPPAPSGTAIGCGDDGISSSSTARPGADDVSLAEAEGGGSRGGQRDHHGQPQRAAIEIPIVDGGVSAEEWGKLLPGIWFYDPAFMATACAASSIT